MDAPAPGTPTPGTGPLDLLHSLGRDGAAFADAALAAGLDAAVASCPGWTVADLVWHLGEVHDFWRWVVRTGAPSWEDYVQPPRPADTDLVDWYRQGLADTVDVLRAADPDDQVWTWASDHRAAWVVRRMAHETAMHRWDAEQAAGRADARVDGPLASDGIDEFLTWFLADAADGADAVGGSVHLHCGDVPGEWTLRPAAPDDPASGGPFVVTREHAKGDCALRGPASDLLLVLWRRRPLDTVDVVGDADVAARFVAWPALR